MLSTDHLPETLCGIPSNPQEWRAACIIHGRPPGKDPPTLAELVDMVGKTGGHMGRSFILPVFLRVSAFRRF